MNGEAPETPPEIWRTKLGKALVEDALKNVLRILVLAVVGWAVLYIGGRYDIVRCTVLEFFGSAYCGDPAQPGDGTGG